MIKSNPYKNNQLYSVGIEEEYMVCNPKTGDLIDKASLIPPIKLDKIQTDQMVLLILFPNYKLQPVL